MKILPRDKKPNKLKVVALFAGAGGLHLGLEQVGFEVIAATDIMPTAEATHKINWPGVPFILEDVRKLSVKRILEATGGVRPDMVCGGPPCQGFSTLGDKISSDPRNQLFDAFAKIVGELKPKYVLIENVKAITTMYGGQYKDFIIKTFSSLGYKMYLSVLNSANYGVPQIRQRAIFFGTRSGNSYAFPESTHGDSSSLKVYETVGKAIMDLAEKGEEVPNHIALDHSDKVIARYKFIPEGGKLPHPDQLPREIRRKNFGNTYKRLHREFPSLTMVPGNNAFPIHPTLNRSLTPREAARIQTFPDDFVFVGDRRNQCILVGNAVPPALAKAIGKSILRHAQGKTPTASAAIPVSVSPGSSNGQHFIARNKNNSKMKSNSFIDLFSGAGGFVIGFARGGWTPLLAADYDKNVADTHQHNFPDIPFSQADLSDKNEVLKIINGFAGEDVGLVVGGPPCQGFSMFGKRRFINTKGHDPHQDPRNKLVVAFLDIVKGIKPRWFLMENVPGLANLDGGNFLKAIIDEFKEAGYYNVEYKILNAADYGVPQFRKRLVIIGNRTGHIIPWPKKKFFAEPKEWQDHYRTVGEVISDLADEASYSKYTCHVPMNHKPLLVERYGYIPEGGKLDIESLPEHLKKGYRTDEVKNYSHVFKRLHRNKPATTMVPGHNAFPIHPWLNRALTVREAARIQTFPDEMEFKGSRQNQCIQVGNAFPPLLAELIANNIRKAEINAWYPGKTPPSAYYSLIEKEDKDSILVEMGIGGEQMFLAA